MGWCRRPPKMPTKAEVSRAETVAHAFECSVGSRAASEQFKAKTENTIRSEPLQ